MKTHKVLITLGLAIMLVFKLQAQDIKFGVLSGLVISNARVTDKFETYNDNRVFYPMYSFNMNGSVEYRISETWRIEAEPGFIMKGGIVRFGINHYMSVIDTKLNYLQLPILANFNFTKKFFISFGPEFAYMINRQEYLPEKATGFTEFKENAFEISGLIGLNYRVSKKIDIGFRYNHGLTKISILKWTDGFGPEIGESKVYNQYFQLIFRFFIQTGTRHKSNQMGREF